MKIAISGKGGTGKTTMAALITHYFKNDGYRVLAIDSDPDANLASAIGIPPEEASSIVPISEQRELIKERTGAKPKQFGQLFKLNPTVSDIPEKYSTEFQGIRLLVMGAVRRGGSGCACPENVLLKNLLSNILLNHKDVIIVDMEAGIEHLGRGTSSSIDMMLLIVEPGSRSVNTAKTIVRLGQQIGIQSFYVIGNKIQSEKQASWIEEQFPELKVLGMISYSESLRDADLFQKSLIDSLDVRTKKEFDKIYQAIGG